MAQEKRRIAGHRAEDKTGRHRVLCGNPGSEFSPVSFLNGALVVAGIISLVYLAGGLSHPNTVKGCGLN